MPMDLKRYLDQHHMAYTDQDGVITVRDELELIDGESVVLPPGLRLAKSLVLAGTHWTELPEDIHVARHLEIHDTRILRLPGRMSVGLSIWPSRYLIDLGSFMRSRRARRVEITPHGTMHDKLALRTQLQEFPDLWTVVQSWWPDVSAVIESDPRGGYSTELR